MTGRFHRTNLQHFRDRLKRRKRFVGYRVFAVVDAEDAESSEGAGDGGFARLYSMNLITGLEVTNTQEDRHYMYPGAFLSSLAANFNIEFGYGRYGVSAPEVT